MKKDDNGKNVRNIVIQCPESKRSLNSPHYSQKTNNTWALVCLVLEELFIVGFFTDFCLHPGYKKNVENKISQLMKNWMVYISSQYSTEFISDNSCCLLFWTVTVQINFSAVAILQGCNFESSKIL